ncbi:MAG: thioredoxin domain-containing protein [Candidatus Kariarchaeaceae archaeon]|jgi:uncharacterized protein YyaL (SSP411 family)
MTNRLADESSPYLQQHKDNPVDWYPWGEEAKKIAKDLNKPLFISIGYSTCHWCHVMARESFEDEVTAAYMNANFVNIKMDREEYPGVDKAYQEMFQMLHRRGGGWPLSVWAHPDGTPFYIGTYFPEKPRHSMPSFMDVNQQLMAMWGTDRQALDTQGSRLAAALRQSGSNWKAGTKELSEDLYYKEIIGLQSRFDTQFGGIGGAPKFPRIETLRYLLREGLVKDIKEAISFVSFTYHKMSRGGIYDQLGGGFARYSVDREWLVPHFEKMLYDNGALLQLGAELAQATDDKFVEFVVRDTIAWMAREMRHPGGAFYAAQNAESEGREGAFFVWHVPELREVLGEHYGLAASRYGITDSGNFDDPHHPEIKGMNVLSVVKTIDQLVEEFEKDRDEIIDGLEHIRKTLYEVRDKREHPSTDTKILTSWNGIAIRGLLAAGQLLDYDKATQLGLEALEFLVTHHIKEDTVLRRYHETEETKMVEGVLDDYSFLIASLIDAYEVTDDFEKIRLARKILQWTDTKFFNTDEGLYYVNPSGADDLFAPVLQTTDDSMASGLGVMVYNLFKLGKYLEEPALISRGDEIINRLLKYAGDYPGAMSTTLNSASPYFRYPHELVLTHPTPELDRAVLSHFIPDRLVYRYHGESDKPDWEVLENRTESSEPTVYICKGQTCSLPLHSVDSVHEELQR